MTQHLKAHVSQNVMDRGGHIRTSIVIQHDETALNKPDAFTQWKHEGLRQFHIFTVVRSVDKTQHPGTEGQFICPVWTNSALGIPAFNCVTVLPLALICPFCCTAIGWMPVRQAYCHIFKYMKSKIWPPHKVFFLGLWKWHNYINNTNFQVQWMFTYLSIMPQWYTEKVNYRINLSTCAIKCLESEK